LVLDAVIRPATEADIAAITPIYAHAVRHGTASFEIDPPSVSEMTDRYRSLADAGYPYLVAEHEQAVRGYAYAGPYRTRIGYRYVLEDSIYISPEFQRFGIGRLLLARLLAEATSRGFRQMIAVIGDSGHLASIALHQSAGFRTVGTLEAVGFKFGRWIDSVLMQRPLGAGAMTSS
jgi:L-amino acid N-acyltransferase YncA